jgi:hypothetical protein
LSFCPIPFFFFFFDLAVFFFFFFFFFVKASKHNFVVLATVDAGSTAKAQLLVRKKYQNFIIFIDCFCRLSTRQNCLEFHSMSDDSAPMDHENLVRKKKQLKKKKKNLTLKSLHRHSRSLPFDAICARCNATERLYRQFDSQHVQFSFFFVRLTTIMRSAQRNLARSVSQRSGDCYIQSAPLLNHCVLLVSFMVIFVLRIFLFCLYDFVWTAPHSVLR